MQRGRIALTGTSAGIAGQLDKVESAYLSTNS
jgi:hypothetical protein